MVKDPFRALDDEDRGVMDGLLERSTHAALAVVREDGTTSVTRVAFSVDKDRVPVTLISDLSLHTKALRSGRACSLLIGDPGDKGDPLTHPRLTLHCVPKFATREDAGYADLREWYLERWPKAKLYVDFAGFNFVRFEVVDGLLNAGFGKAYRV